MGQTYGANQYPRCVDLTKSTDETVKVSPLRSSRFQICSTLYKHLKPKERLRDSFRLLSITQKKMRMLNELIEPIQIKVHKGGEMEHVLTTIHELLR